jgi:hypothetical protein
MANGEEGVRHRQRFRAFSFRNAALLNFCVMAVR